VWLEAMNVAHLAWWTTLLAEASMVRALALGWILAFQFIVAALTMKACSFMRVMCVIRDKEQSVVFRELKA